MRKMVIGLAFVALSSPASAAKVTNLDHVPHVVRYDFAGGVQQEQIAPGSSTRFLFGDGTLTLMNVPQKEASRVSAKGLLAGTIGTPGTRMQADKYDEFVIWPGGKMLMQRRIKMHGN